MRTNINDVNPLQSIKYDKNFSMTPQFLLVCERICLIIPYPIERDT